MKIPRLEYCTKIGGWHLLEAKVSEEFFFNMQPYEQEAVKKGVPLTVHFVTVRRTIP